MVHIQNSKVYVPEELHHLAKTPGVLILDAHGAYTCAALFLSGPNPWGLHQHPVFAESLSAIRASVRIGRAAAKALNESSFEVLPDDHSLLLRALLALGEMGMRMSPAMARQVLPVLQAIEEATEK